jgi:hypothetical protein
MDKKYLPVIIIGLVGFLLLVAAGVVFWRRGQVLQPALPTLTPAEITPWITQPSREPAYNLKTQSPAVEKLPVYRYEYATGDARKRAENWARILGFAGEPLESESVWRGPLYTWTAGGSTLVVDQNATTLSYSIDLLADPQNLAGSYLPTFTEAAAVVERTLEEFGVVSGLLEHDSTKNRALKTGAARVKETTLTEAELLEIHFIAKIDDYPVYLPSGPGTDPVLAWVGYDGKLLRLEYHPIGTVGEKIGDYPLKNEEELLNDLEEGKGTVVETTLEADQKPVAMTITRVRLGYLLPTAEAMTIQPIFVISGQAVTADGIVGQTTIYLPAVSQD